ncbi:hypothetical protein M419DRAFT_117554, partial [Trichoderma reesei RUT C-30]
MAAASPRPSFCLRAHTHAAESKFPRHHALPPSPGPIHSKAPPLVCFSSSPPPGGATNRPPFSSARCGTARTRALWQGAPG